MVARALRDYADWTEAGHDWTVAVNVSARNLSSLQLVTDVLALLEDARVPAGRLHLEVTETAMAFDGEMAGEVVRALSLLGISMSVDDFGTGFTVLSQLRTLAVSEIKVDRTFVTHVADNEQDQAIVASLIDLGHRLGFRVTAEGVETSEAAAWLTDAGCDHAQGYLWSRPTAWTDVADRCDRLPDAPSAPAATAGREARV